MNFSPSLGYLARLKVTYPFSPRLNDFIHEKVDQLGIKIRITHDPMDDWEQLKNSDPLNQVISMIGCENTIFGDTMVNVKFHAWHDYIHITEGLDLSPVNEAAVAFIQASQLPYDWWYEKHLIMCEVVGQVVNHERTGSFNDDQRSFTRAILYNGETGKNYNH